MYLSVDAPASWLANDAPFFWLKVFGSKQEARAWDSYVHTEYLGFCWAGGVLQHPPMFPLQQGRLPGEFSVHLHGKEPVSLTVGERGPRTRGLLPRQFVTLGDEHFTGCPLQGKIRKNREFGGEKSLQGKIREFGKNG